jgi:3,4-dihydroxy 2-butanone 4-phosphate synthase/GTP cyclohydrolase II
MTTETDTSAFSPVDEVIADIAAGKLVVITDDAARENEGDLIGAADLITPEAVNFMAVHGRGLICTPLDESAAERLGLPEMVERNREAHRTKFTVSVDAAEGVTTGISAADRARTILALANPLSEPGDLVRPGHVFPLIARSGGVLRRAGHTEAAVDLARLAGRQPVGVICEILKDDGTLARIPELVTFVRKHGLKMCSIEQLIQYRGEREHLVEKVETVNMPTAHGDFDLHLYRSRIDGKEHIALVKGDITTPEPVLVRVHSECLTGDVFGSRRCDCGEQLHDAMACITAEGRGIVLYMRQEGRGIGLANKLHAYKLQQEGYDTVEANQQLGFASDLRDYGIGAQILHDLGARELRLLTNNPRKVIGLDGHRLKIVERVPLTPPSNEHNARYLETKKTKLGHML